MKQLKLLTILMLLALALVCFAACGETATDEGATTNEGTSEEATSSDEPQEMQVHMTYCDTDTENRSTIQCAYWLQQKWADETNGACVMDVYCNNVLGDDDEVLKGLLLGTCDYFTGMGVVADVTGTIGAIPDMPFVYASYEDWYNGNWNLGGIEIYNNAIAGTGYICPDMQYAGAKHIVSRYENYETLDDLKGVKIRCTNNDMNITLWNALGANPSPVAWGELYTALDQGTVDAMEHSLGICVDQRFYEPAPYFTLTYHTFCPYIAVCSENWYNSLPDEWRDYVLDSLHEMNMYQHELELDAEANTYMKVLEDAGCSITTIPDETRAQMVELSDAVYDFMREECGAEVVDAYLATGGQV